MIPETQFIVELLHHCKCSLPPQVVVEILRRRFILREPDARMKLLDAVNSGLVEFEEGFDVGIPV